MPSGAAPRGWKVSARDRGTSGAKSKHRQVPGLDHLRKDGHVRSCSVGAPSAAVPREFVSGNHLSHQRRPDLVQLLVVSSTTSPAQPADEAVPIFLCKFIQSYLLLL